MIIYGIAAIALMLFLVAPIRGRILRRLDRLDCLDRLAPLVPLAGMLAPGRAGAQVPCGGILGKG
jgi:hypothetical protein